MSGPEMMPPDDDALADFLAGRGAVREAYRAQATEQPSAAMDAAVLAAARAAGPQRSGASRRAGRWSLPLASAAVLMLSFGVFLQVQRDPVARQAVTAAPAVMPAEPVLPPPEVAAELPPLQEAQATVAAAEEANRAARRSRPAPVEPRRTSQARASAPVVSSPSLPPPPPTLTSAPQPALAGSQLADAPAAALDAAQAPTMAQEAAPVAVPQPPIPPPAANRIEAFAKSSRLMAAPEMLRAPERDDAATVALEAWANGCASPRDVPRGTTRWRGLDVQKVVVEQDASFREVRLHFAPRLTLETLQSTLGPLAQPAELETASCAVPERRELREQSPGWALVCECARPRQGD